MTLLMEYAKYVEYAKVAFLGFVGGATFIGVMVYLLKTLIVEKLKTSFQKDHSKFLEELKYEFKVREQAIKVAEYLAHARQLAATDPKEKFMKINQLSWELAIWLPEEIYKGMVQAIANPSLQANELTNVVAVRRMLLGIDKAGELTANDIAVHGPNYGRPQT
jgi:hypothetical protein